MTEETKVDPTCLVVVSVIELGPSVVVTVVGTVTVVVLVHLSAAIGCSSSALWYVSITCLEMPECLLTKKKQNRAKSKGVHDVNN